MEILAGLSIGVLVYLAFAFDVAGFMARDELWWRMLMLIASGFYLIYYFFVVDQPLWDAIITNGILGAVNLAMIGVVIRERSTLGMGAETLDLFRLFPHLSPGQFRRMMRVADRIEVKGPETLVERHEHPEHLFFVIDGPVTVDKGGELNQIAARTFIAEIAYLTGAPASATVRVDEGAIYLKWPTDKLRDLLHRAPALQTALIASINIDLAQKVAHSLPRGIGSPVPSPQV
jgi:hypothetical protein